MESRRRRELFREVNDRIHELLASIEPDLPGEFLCECGEECGRRVELLPTAFETCGDRGEEARILSEMAWTHLAAGETAVARRSFLEAVQAHTDIASVRGVGVALVGLAAAEAVEGRPERGAILAAAAEVFAQDEGIVVVYSDETPGRELVEQARAALSEDDLAAATEAGRRLTIEEALALVRGS